MRFKRIWVLLTFAALLPAVGLAGDGPFLSVDNIKPGMKGYGKTVFRGDTIERFDAEIISVVKNTMPKGDMILARLSGGPLKESGLIAGMSGSPVYIGDKLIGAVAYGWTFAKEPIAGITPIEEMVRVGQEAGRNPQAASGAGGPSPRTPMFEDVFLPMPFSTQPVWTAPGGARALRIPVMVSGASPATLQRLAPSLEPFNLFPVAGGAPAGAVVGKAVFEAGSPLGVQLVRGDVDMVAVGTLTYRDGNKVLAFGHPMLQSGDTDMPMVAAYIHTVIPSQDQSFKLGGSTAVMGRVVEDRRAGVSGEVGQFAKMIPCHVTVKNLATGQEHAYRYEMISQRLLTAPLLHSVAVESVGATEGLTGDSMVAVNAEVRIAGQAKPVTMENLYFESGEIGTGFMEVAQRVSLLMNNPFEAVRLEGFEIRADVRPGRHTATIDSITAEKRSVKAGETVHLKVNLRPYESSEIVSVPLDVEAPESLPEGHAFMVTASDSVTGRLLDRMANPALFRPENLAQLLALIERREDNRDIVLRVTMPSLGVSLHGETLPNLPPSLMNIIAYGNQSSATPVVNEVVRRHQTEWVLSGSQGLSLTVEQEK